MEGDKGVPDPGFKFVKVRKLGGTIITVKRPVSVVAPRAHTSATVEASSGVKSAISVTDTVKQAPTRVDQPTSTASTSTTKAPTDMDESKDAETISVKTELREKRKISVPWIGTKERPKTTSNEEVDKPKYPFAKLRATVGNTTKRMEAMGNAVARIGEVLAGDAAEKVKSDVMTPITALS
jgi:hypothetical protein